MTVTILCIGENNVPVSGSSVGVGGILDGEALEETVIVLTLVLLLGIAAMKEYNIAYYILVKGKPNKDT